jgi:hypothetical protein
MTAAPDTFWHVEDYAEPGLAGLPGPIEGGKSAWCGAPPGPYEYMCHWIAAPGYGNSWDQSLVTDLLYFSGTLRLSYHGRFDSEPEHDRTSVEYDAGGGNWVEVAMYDGQLDTVAVHELLLAQAATKLRFHFTSDGAWSDEDGLWDSNGAAHIDSITISDGAGLIDYEDFESAADNALRSGIWHAATQEEFGICAKLRGGIEDEDPCNTNFTTQIVFWDEENWVGPGFGQPITPFCKGAGGIEAPCQSELVVSPAIGVNRYSPNVIVSMRRERSWRRWSVSRPARRSRRGRGRFCRRSWIARTARPGTGMIRRAVGRGRHRGGHGVAEGWMWSIVTTTAPLLSPLHACRSFLSREKICSGGTMHSRIILNRDLQTNMRTWRAVPR